MREIKFRGKGVGKSLTLGSLFDGIAGFPLSASKVGIKAVWASEIEPWPIKVTEKHFPGMAHLGDLTKINGTEIPPVDVITFGSPCQDLSVAGKRAGLEGQRSGLFMEAVRIIREMREATYGTYPRFAVWENVPGAFSSNRGEDFRAVLEEIAEAEIPMPRSGKWATAGMVRTERVDVAWRVLDAQHWGVPQRRRRIFLVADFAGGSAGEVLFKSEGLSGYSKESFRMWQGTAGCFENGIRETGTSSVILNDQGGNRMDITEDVTCTLRAEAHHPPCVMDAAVFDNHGRDTRFTGPIDVAPTISATYGTGGNNQPFVVGDTPKTLKIRCGCEGGGKGALIQDNKSATLCASDYKFPQQQQIEEGKAVVERVAVENYQHSGYRESDTAGILKQSGGTNGDGSESVIIENRYAVRRLTPLECLRLQGYPDWWLDIEGMSDTAKYKAIGNSLAIPCSDFVMAGIARVMREEVTHADRH